MNNIEQIVHKNYLLANLCYSISPYPAVVRLVRDKHGDIVVAFQKDSTRKSTIGPAKWLDKNGVSHAWKVEGHPEFESLVGTYMYTTIGNVMCPDFAWYEECMNPSLDYLKSIWPEYVFRAYAFDTIINKFNYGIVYKKNKSSDFYEALHEAELNIAQYFLRNEKEIVKQFMRLHNDEA